MMAWLMVRFPPIADIRGGGHNGSMGERSRYVGMTVSERLFDAGLLQAFNAAVRQRNRAELIRLLTYVEVEDAAYSADAILKSP
jgi:hypothetical protein